MRDSKERPGNLASGTHRTERTHVALPAELVEPFRAEARREGMTLVEWLTEAGRAYVILSKRDLTAEDWLAIMGNGAALQRAAARAARSASPEPSKIRHKAAGHKRTK